MGGYTAPPDFQNSNFAPPLKILLDETLIYCLDLVSCYISFFKFFYFMVLYSGFSHVSITSYYYTCTT